MATDQLDLISEPSPTPPAGRFTRLTSGEATVAELAAPFRVSQPAILPAPQGPRAGGSDRPHAARHGQAQPPAGGAAARGDRVARRLQRVLGGELRAAGRAARTVAASRGRPIATRRSGRKEHVMTETTGLAVEPGIPQLQGSRTFDAPPELVLRAWTDPELVVRWLGPRRLRMRIEEWDARHGGAWRYIHIDEDGSEYGFRGVFHGTPSVDGMSRRSSSRERVARPARHGQLRAGRRQHARPLQHAVQTWRRATR